MESRAHLRPYLRDGVPGLPVERQEEMLRAAGIDLTDAYVDRLSKSQIKRRDSAALVERAAMLKPTSRGRQETIVVAGLRVLGWSVGEVARVLVEAGKRNANVHAADVDKTFSADTLAETELLEALSQAERAHGKAVRGQSRSAAVEAAAAMRRKRRQAKLDAAAELWVLPPGEISAGEIAEKVGLSQGTLYRYLGHRADARDRAKGKGKEHA